MKSVQSNRKRWGVGGRIQESCKNIVDGNHMSGWPRSSKLGEYTAVLDLNSSTPNSYFVHRVSKGNLYYLPPHQKWPRVSSLSVSPHFIICCHLSAPGSQKETAPDNSHLCLSTDRLILSRWVSVTVIAQSVILNLSSPVEIGKIFSFIHI